MSDRDQYFGESGFVDATDEALDESREDTVSAPAYSQEEPAQPEVEPPQTQIAVDVADLEWLPVSDREESYSGDAPLAAPHEPAETKPRRSDFFDRNAAAASRALFGQGGRGASSSGSL